MDSLWILSIDSSPNVPNRFAVAQKFLTFQVKHRFEGELNGLPGSTESTL